MAILVIVMFFVAASCGSAMLTTEQQREVKRIQDKDIATLTSVYSLVDHHLGGFKVAQTWMSSKTVNGNPEATSYLLVLNDGACGSWVKFVDTDRLFVWHEGKTMIDMILEDGTMTTKCLGDTKVDQDCRYIVHIPANIIADIRVENYVILSGIPLMGTSADGTVYDYDDILATYPQHSDIIKLTEKCYRTV